MKEQQEKQEKVEYFLKYTVNKDSTEGILIEYLKLERYGAVNQLILQSMMSYWLPLALEKKENYNPEELRRFAEQSIYELRRQADYFACKFGISVDNLPQNYYQGSSYVRGGNTEPYRKNVQELQTEESENGHHLEEIEMELSAEPEPEYQRITWE